MNRVRMTMQVLGYSRTAASHRCIVSPYRTRWLRTMSMLGKTIKGLAVAGICGVGLCALAERTRLTERLSRLAQSVEGVPFPGTGLYPFLAGREFRRLYTAVAEQMVGSGIRGRVLDLGTGLGYIPIDLARMEPTLAAHGIDSSPEMIRIARANAFSEGVGRKPQFGVGNPMRMPFPGRFFDLVVSVNILGHWIEPRKVLQEIYHVLKLGGEFWGYDFRKDIPRETWSNLREKLPSLERLLLQVSPTASGGASIGEAAFVQMAREAHFEVVSVEETSLPAPDEPMPLFVRVRLRRPNLTDAP